MAVSFLQRMVEGAMLAPFQAAKHGFMGAARSPFKAGSYKKHGEALVKDTFSSTRSALEDTSRWMDDSISIMGDKNRSWARRGVAGAGLMGKGVFGMGHTTMAMGIDAVKAPINIAARTAGFAVGTTARVGLGVGFMVGKPVAKASMKAGWSVTKHTAPGMIKAGAMAGGELAKDVGYTAAGTAKALWKHRNNPMMGSAIVGGALAAGAVLGNSDYEQRAMFGNEYGGKGTGSGYMNPQIQAPAWQLTKTAQSGIAGAVQKTMDEKGGYEAVEQYSGPMGNNMGATGDLVFALNALRNGGMG